MAGEEHSWHIASIRTHEVMAEIALREGVHMDRLSEGECQDFSERFYYEAQDRADNDLEQYNWMLTRLSELCLRCEDRFSRQVSSMGEYSEESFARFVVSRLRLGIDRVNAGKPLHRCEVLWGFDAGRCRNDASEELDGRYICGSHARKKKRGKKLQFSANPTDPHPLTTILACALEAMPQDERSHAVAEAIERYGPTREDTP